MHTIDRKVPGKHRWLPRQPRPRRRLPQRPRVRTLRRPFRPDGRLARGRIREVADEIRRDLPNFTGPVFEDVCRDWVGRYSALGEGALEVGSWWSRRSDVEVDVVTLEKKGYGLLGSCKWWRKRVGAAELDDLYRARAVMGPKAAQARLALFARGGFTPEVVERASLENVTLVGPDDLFGRLPQGPRRRDL